MPELHHRTCNICEANCGLVIRHEGARVLSIKGDPDNALSRGFICPKAVALQDVQDDPDRLRRPLKRIGDDWAEIGWEQAFAEIGARTRALLAADPRASAVYRGNPNAHNFGSLFYGQPLFAALGQPQRYSASTVDQIPTQVAALRMLGHANLWGVPDIERCQTLIVLGGNPMASNGSLWTVPDFRNRVKALHARGGRLVVIDPRRTETAEIADRHLFIRPASDVYFLAALLQSVMRRAPARPLHPLASGLGQVADALRRFEPAACAAACGIGLEDIDALAASLAAGRAALYGRMGVSVQQHGTLNAWLINLVNIASGNYDREGGIVFSTPAVDGLAAPSPTVGTLHSRVSGHRDALGEFPAAALAEEIETPGPGQVKALFVIAGNPTLSVPNGPRLARALQQLELLVVVDMYRNATARLAHYVLPPVGPLQRDHYGMVLLPAAVRNFAKYSPPMLPQRPGELQDWEILRGLAAAISGQPVPMPPPTAILDKLLRSGPYKLSLEELARHPSGMDFGPCTEDRLQERLRTADRRIQCAPEEFLAALAALEPPRAATGTPEPISAASGTRSTSAPAAHADLLYLLGRRHLRSNNSWLGNSHRLVKGRNRCTLLIHPHDAAARGIADGMHVEVCAGSRVVGIEAEVSDEMMPGTISIPHGWGHALPGVAMSVALAHAGVSVNDLTDETQVDPLSGNAALSGVRVLVRRPDARAAAAPP